MYLSATIEPYFALMTDSMNLKMPKIEHFKEKTIYAIIETNLS